MNMEKYNVKWHEQSKNSSESMPVGGHDIGLNVWVEKGELLFYIDRSGSFDENNQMLKLGRVRLKLQPNPFENGIEFLQELKLKQGYIEVIGKSLQGLQVHIEIWVEVFKPVVHVEVYCNQLINVEATFESWRINEREIPPAQRMSALSNIGYPGKVVTHPDKISFQENDVLFFHKNRNDDLVFDKVVELQGLSDYKEQLWNPQKNFTFGGIMHGNGMIASGNETGTYVNTEFKGWKLSSEVHEEYHHIALFFHAAQTESEEKWCEQLMELVYNCEGTVEEAKRETRQWWREYWERSYINIFPENTDVENKPWQVARNYNIFRYMLGCNAYGTYPTKFNGGLFTFDAIYMSDMIEWGVKCDAETPDFRLWGGGSFTAQNQRLVYWPMLKTGDFDMMKPQFDFYNRGLGAAELRTKVYWNHEGCCFTEHVESFGLPVGGYWGWFESEDSILCRTKFDDPTDQMAAPIKYHFINQLEFAYMIMKFHQYSKADILEYIPFIESSIRFFDEHYQKIYCKETYHKLDENGKLVFFPSTACETYKFALNPTDLIAGMIAAVKGVLELPKEYISTERKEYYTGLLERIPTITFREMNGKKTITPAEHWKGIANVEIPQLYSVFPYELFGLGKEDLQVAIDTWHYGTDSADQKNHTSWHQDNIFCARLGLTDEAATITTKKLENGPFRFPTFWGPGHDWVPDHNWGGSGMIGLQDMLMQTNGEKILLFPAWPKKWDVEFKLHAPMNTVIEGSYIGGVLQMLKVEPESRYKDVIVCE